MNIKTPSRLHMTLIDLNGSYGRSGGGIGLTLSDPYFSLNLEPSEKDISIDFKNQDSEEIQADCRKKIEISAQLIKDYFNLDTGFHFTVNNAYPTHSGLGSGSQTALATGKLMYEYAKKNSLLSKEYENISILKLGEILKRGISSGIGIFAFENGGFIVDGGYNLKEKGSILPDSDAPFKPPQFLSRFDFPEDWNVVVAIADGDSTVTGVKEDVLFAQNCPVPQSEVEKLSHTIFMNLIPFLLEKNIEEFGKYINQIQDLGFKKVEVGLQPPKIKNLMEKMREFGAYGVGMSSFGPALYAITDKNTKEVYKSTKEYLGDDGLVFISKPQNHGYEQFD